MLTNFPFKVVIFDSFDNEYAIGFPESEHETLGDAVKRADELNQNRQADHYDVFNEDYSKRLYCGYEVGKAPF